MAEPRITVAGGGIGGMAAALLLARAGARVTLFERVREPEAVGAAIALYPNGLAVLYGLGLRDALLARAHRAYSGTIGLDGRPVIEVPLPDFGHGIDHALALHRNRLFTVLAEAVAAEPGVTAHYGHEVTAATANGGVRVATPDGPRDHPGDLVVAADGISSAVRGCGDFGARRRHTSGVAARLIVPGEPFGESVGENWSRYGIAITSRLGDGTSYLALSASRGPARDALLRRDLPALRRLGDAMAPGAGAVLGEVTEADLLVTPIDTVACARWASGRRVLLGDAAHAMTPHLGQGANTALLDAYVLAAELAHRGDLRAAVAAYIRRRRRTADRVRLASHAYGLFNEGLTGRFTRPVRDTLLRLAGRLPGTENAVATFMQEDPATTHEDIRTLTPHPHL